MTQLHFTAGAAETAVIGIYSVVAAAFYIPLVWTIGTGIQLFRRFKNRDD